MACIFCSELNISAIAKTISMAMQKEHQIMFLLTLQHCDIRGLQEYTLSVRRSVTFRVCSLTYVRIDGLPSKLVQMLSSDLLLCLSFSSFPSSFLSFLQFSMLECLPYTTYTNVCMLCVYIVFFNNTYQCLLFNPPPLSEEGIIGMHFVRPSVRP